MISSELIEFWKPILHWRAPDGLFMNDPNGLIYHEGTWHLFFQYWAYPGGGGIGWQHTTSPDLLHWSPAIPAMPPANGVTAASGSVVAQGNRLAMFYTAWVGLGFNDIADGLQEQNLAWSDDGGTTWTLDPSNPVIPNPGVQDFRDPKVVRFGDHWICAIAAGPEVVFYRSLDLQRWERSGRASLPAEEGLIWECPDLMPLGDRWALVVSQFGGADVRPQPGGVNANRIFIGRFDGTDFLPDSSAVEMVDEGPDCYALVSFADAPAPAGSQVVMGWMSNWMTANREPTPPAWSGQMTLPRLLSKQGSHAVSHVHPALEAALGTPVPFSPELRAEVGRLRLTIQGEGVLHLRQSGDRSLAVRVSADRVTLDRANAHAVEVHEGLRLPSVLHRRRTGPLALEIWLDRSSAEVFIDGGERVGSVVFYPDPDQTGVSWEGSERAVEGEWRACILSLA